MDRAFAAELARLSALSYEAPETVAARLAPLAPWPFARAGTDGFIVELLRATVVVFRGTQVTADWSWRDIFTNFRLGMTPWSAGGLAHAGYAAALLEVWPDIAAELAHRSRPFVFTGHSLGGALATLAGTLEPTAAAVYTFGAPRAGDRALADVPRAPLYRIVHGIDIAPRFPTVLRGYRHHGRRWKLARSGALYPSKASWLSAAPWPGLIGVADHRIGEYARKLAGALVF